jgi:periplasmic divalent cation tolerance protein
MTEVLILVCTCPDAATARRLAGGLLESKLVACVNILPEIRSMYRWQGELHDDGEALMVVKTGQRAYAEVEAWLLQHHPYDVPEVLAVQVQAGSAAYLEWVQNEIETQ